MARSSGTDSGAKESSATRTVEFVGPKPYGREFIGSHTLTKKALSNEGVEIDKDLRFDKSNRWSQQIPADNGPLVEMLEKSSVFKFTD